MKPTAAGRARVGDRHHEVGLDRRLCGEPLAHAHAHAVHLCAGERRVRPREIDVLEDAERLPPLRDRLGRVDALLVDHDELAGTDVSLVDRADQVEGAGLGRDDPVVAQPAERERPDPLRIAEGEQLSLRERDDRVGALEPWHRPRDRFGDRRRVVRDQRRDRLGVGGGAERDPVGGELVPQLRRVGQVAVVADRDRAGAAVVDERLRVRPGVRAGGRVAGVPDRDVARAAPAASPRRTPARRGPCRGAQSAGRGRRPRSPPPPGPGAGARRGRSSESRATSRSAERMPKTPHISRGPPEARRAGCRAANRRRRRRACGSGRRRAGRRRRARRRAPPGRRPRRTRRAGRPAASPRRRSRSGGPPSRARPRGPPSETSWTSEQLGAARRRNSISAASASRSRRAGLPPTSPKRAWYSEPASATGEAPASRTTSPSRQAPGTRRTSSSSPTQPTTGRRVDRAPVGLVVERDVARDDRDPQRLARFRHPLDRLDELPRDRALLRVAEVEAVGQADRLGAGAGDVPRRLEHRQPAAGARVETPHPAGAVERDGETAVTRPQPQHGGVEPGPPDGARADEVVVAPVDVCAAADVVAAEQLERAPPDARARHGSDDCGWLVARLRLDACSAGTRR